MSGRRHPSLVFVLAFVLSAALVTSPAAAGSTPSLRLFVASDHLTVDRNRRDVVFVDPGAYVTPVGKDFKLIVNRPDYDTPVTAKQVDPDSGLVLRTITDDRLAGWSGLAEFAHFTVVNGRGETVASQDVTFCPYASVRLSDASPITSAYPFGCFAYGPFFRGTVWGVDVGWASPLSGGYYYGGYLRWKARGDAYTIRVQIDPTWADLLGIPPSDATAEVSVSVGDGGTTMSPGSAPAAPEAPGLRPLLEHADRHRTRPRDAAGLLRSPGVEHQPASRLHQLQCHGMERGARAHGGRRLPGRRRVDDGRLSVLPA
jgi:hypothetical protein